jgi:NAD(P)-dependent dehydrogenase (short-subunit alcohol dehydrogenase family)
VFIASMRGHIINWPQQHSAYNASKASVKMIGKSLAAKWAAHKIRVNTIISSIRDRDLYARGIGGVGPIQFDIFIVDSKSITEWLSPRSPKTVSTRTLPTIQTLRWQVLEQT